MPVAVDYGVESVVDVVTDLFGLDIKSTNFDEARIFCPVHEKDACLSSRLLHLCIISDRNVGDLFQVRNGPVIGCHDRCG